MEAPLISIIIPVYNTGRYLSKCIDSILDQSFSSFQLILVNDGSTDDSGLVCDYYAGLDPRVEVLHKENGGVSSARNYGIEKAGGKFLCFVDSDDWVDNKFLENFELFSKIDSDMLIQGYVRFRDDCEIGRASYHSSSFRDFESFFLYSEKNTLLNSPCFKLFKKSIVIDHGIRFNTNFSLGEDHIFSLEFLFHANTYSVGTGTGYFYRISSEGDSLTTRLVDLNSFKNYIICTDELRMKIASKYQFNEEVINHLYKETNKWVIFIVHALLDERRTITTKEKVSKLEGFLSLLKNGKGVSKVSRKGDLYNFIFLKTLESRWLSTRCKLFLLQNLKSI